MTIDELISPRVLGVIQARMGSSRLPNKMLMNLHGVPLIEWVVHRLRATTRIDHLVVAIPQGAIDDPLAVLLERLDVDVFRGAEDDVLSRFYNAAQRYQPEYVVRICADNPLLCPSLIDVLIQKTIETSCDYAVNLSEEDGYIDGIACAELCSFRVLEHLQYKTTQAAHREHVFGYLRANLGEFSIFNNRPTDSNLSNPKLSLDVDTHEDLQTLAKAPLHIDISLEEILEIFQGA